MLKGVALKLNIFLSEHTCIFFPRESKLIRGNFPEFVSFDIEWCVCIITHINIVWYITVREDTSEFTVVTMVLQDIGNEFNIYDDVPGFS